MELPKTYRTVARLGWRSDTGDPEGKLEHTGRVPERLELPTGELMQRPPAYSAVRVGGERLYQRARRGEAIEGEPRPVSVYRFEELWPRRRSGPASRSSAPPGPMSASWWPTSAIAYCEQLERTRIGPFRLEDADPERVVPLGEALEFLPERPLEPEEAERVSHGARLPAAGEAGPVRMTSAGELVAIGEPRGPELAPVVVFAPR